jgi:hypothetical protein
MKALSGQSRAVLVTAALTADADLAYDDAVELHLLLEAVGRITEALNE